MTRVGEPARMLRSRRAMSRRRVPLLLLAVSGLVACGGAVDDKSPAPPAGTTPSRTGSPPDAPTASPSSPSPPRTPVPVPDVLASSYDQTCNTTDECAPLSEMKDCGCACANAAINKRDLPRANRDIEAHWKACQANDAPGCGADCIAPDVVCDTSTGLVGTCRLVPR
jgi:hypothetical protein